MIIVLYSLLLLSSLLHVTTCTVYTVTPDDHYPSTTCHHCHNLQHYLLNVTKYFTSNTQLLFLLGLHHLHTDLIIQNVHNISLIGSTDSDILSDTVIQCGNSTETGILLNKIAKVTIKDLIFQDCSIKTSNQKATTTSIEILNCFHVYMQNVIISGASHLGIIATNVLKEFSLVSITSKNIKII